MRSVVVKISFFVLSLLGSLGALECYVRSEFPFSQNVWPSRSDPQVGFVFTPGAELLHTNFYDYAQRQRVNSLGFLEREPSFTFAENERRVAVIGDSFIEAVQVDIEQKLPYLLERQLQKHYPTSSIKTLGFGYSGVGTSNELPFYTEVARRFKPQLVVLVFVSNDFGNNSSLLEAVRQGWSVDQPPRLYFRKTAAGFIRIEPARDWQSHILPASTVPLYWPLRWFDALQPLAGSLRSFYWARGRLEKQGAARYSLQVQAERVQLLRTLSAEGAKLAGWNLPRDANLEEMNFTPKAQMPVAFVEAIEQTEYALNVFKEEVAKDGGTLVVATTSDCSVAISRSPYRPFVPRGTFLLLEDILKRLDIPLLELASYFESRGNPSIQFPHDRHWSPLGHALAAEALSDFIRHGNYL